MSSRTRIGLTLIALSPAISLLGSVIPVLGMLAAYFAPDVFLIGVLLVAVSTIRKLPLRIRTAEPTAIVFTVLFAFNTRLPNVLFDAFNREKLQVKHALSGAVGRPTHIQANTDELSARVNYAASVAPSCYGDGCFVTRGFSGPYSK